jgi:hypothetical protein
MTTRAIVRAPALPLPSAVVSGGASPRVSRVALRYTLCAAPALRVQAHACALHTLRRVSRLTAASKPSPSHATAAWPLLACRPLTRPASTLRLLATAAASCTARWLLPKSLCCPRACTRLRRLSQRLVTRVRCCAAWTPPALRPAACTTRSLSSSLRRTALRTPAALHASARASPFVAAACAGCARAGCAAC